ncbi:MAG TPA: epoxide hydrolase [Ilumatobacter sp.]
MHEFRIGVPESEIDDLHRRLDATRWPLHVDAGWSEGTDEHYLRSLLTSWRHDFDWRQQEQSLNSLRQIRGTIDGIAIHAIHTPGNGPAPMPLLMSHGWPSSFAEWRWVIGALTDPGAHGGDPADAFDVVAPSLPGYGFSETAPTPGMTPRRIAALFAELMSALGYECFGVHGCDWGAYVTALLALDRPDRVVGAHMGMVSLSGVATGHEAGDEDDGYRKRVRAWREEEQGYVALQSTKPATLAYGLNDSPAGLAAWIAEKWRAWSDCSGEPESAISRDDLLTNVSLYWFTNTIGTASRLYRESRMAPVRLAAGERVTVPCGFLLERPGVPSEERTFLDVARIGAPPRARAERAFDVHRWTVIDRGGHFPALEIPEVFVDELRAFFRPVRASESSRP